MSPPIRKQLLHEVPDHIPVNPECDVFFITICCTPRGANQLAHAEAWTALTETIQHRESTGDLRARLLLAMPDHLHALLSFTSTKPIKKVISDLKSWLAKTSGIRWQRDFFDHRLRSWESAFQKGHYIRQNPYRAGLVEEGTPWPYILDRINAASNEPRPDPNR